MSRINRNDVSLMEKKIREKTAQPVLGRVKEVYEHGRVDDDSNFEVDVDTIGDGEVDEQYCPVISPGGNETIDIPRVDDKVLVVPTAEVSDKPFVIGTGWTNKDRPPIGQAGMWRREWESDDSPVGSGNIYMTGYTSYDGNPERETKYELEPEQTFIQIAKNKEDENVDPSEKPDLPFKFEIYDSPIEKEDATEVTIEGNSVDDDDALGMSVNMDFKQGTMTFTGENENGVGEFELKIDVKNETAEITGDSNSGNTMGAQFDFSTDEFKIADGNKFGIKSDGSGNFVWDHKDITFNEVSGDTGGISL